MVCNHTHMRTHTHTHMHTHTHTHTHTQTHMQTHMHTTMHIQHANTNFFRPAVIFFIYFYEEKKRKKKTAELIERKLFIGSFIEQYFVALAGEVSAARACGGSQRSPSPAARNALLAFSK